MPSKEQSDTHLIGVVNAYQSESFDAKAERMRLNDENRSAYFSQIHHSEKIPGQSDEYLPKTSVAVEQFVSVLKNSLTQFGRWFSIELNVEDLINELPITENTLEDLLEFYISNLYDGKNDTKDFVSVIADSSKLALLESVAVFKVHGHKTSKKDFTFSGTETKPKLKKSNPWRLRVDLIPFEDYYPDPTGRGLYEIFETEIDYYELLELAKKGVYDLEAVKSIPDIGGTTQRTYDQKRSESHKGQSHFTENEFRKTVLVREIWGTLLDKDGTVLHENVYMADANKTTIIKKPTPNPYWHQESPFVVVPLIKVPFSLFHKAVFDDGVPLNKAINELFNLMLDGGISSVWGVRQLRTQFLEDARQVQNGIPPATTLNVRPDLPPGVPVLEQVATGSIPADALRMFQIVEQEFNSAVLTNDLKLGNLPAKQVKATEIVEASQSQTVTLNAILRDFETEGIAPILRKALLLILQNADDLDSREVIKAIGLQNASVLSQMSPAERFARFAMRASFNVFGASGTLSKIKDFQKLVSILQLIFANEILAKQFLQKYDMGKVLDEVWRYMNIDPSKFQAQATRQPGQPGQPGQPQGAQPGLDIASIFQQAIRQNTEENPSEAIGRQEGV
jgi:hypothetical protein